MNQQIENTTTTSVEKRVGLPSWVKTAVVALIFGYIGGNLGVLNSNNLKVADQVIGNKSSVVNITEDSAVVKVVESAGPATVSIEGKIKQQIPDDFFWFGNFEGDGNAGVSGSGFIVDPNGLVVTNKHVIENVTEDLKVILKGGEKYPAEVVATDPINDLAILRISGRKDFPFLSLADSSLIKVGEKAIAIGNPQGEYQNSVTVGVVSGVNRDADLGDNPFQASHVERLIQTDAAINPGNSGGPLLNSSGQVIGVNTAVRLDSQGIGFAIASNDVKGALESYQKNGKILRPYLGVRYILLNEEIASEYNLPRKTGAWIRGQDGVSGVVKGSPAEKAGLRENDIIISVDGKDVSENTPLSQLVSGKNVGDTLNLKLLRGDTEINVKVGLEERK